MVIREGPLLRPSRAVPSLVPHVTGMWYFFLMKIHTFGHALGEPGGLGVQRRLRWAPAGAHSIHGGRGADGRWTTRACWDCTGMSKECGANAAESAAGRA